VMNTEEEMEEAVQAFRDLVPQLRRFTRH